MDKLDFIGRSKSLSINVINLMKTYPNEKTYWVISDQVIRSVTSIGANAAEAKGSSSKVEFKRYFEIALKSGNETVYWLELLMEIDPTKMDDILPTLLELKELLRILAASIIRMKGKSTRPK
jgi:four helix bundle protein